MIPREPISPPSRVILYPREDGLAAYAATASAAKWLIEHGVEVLIDADVLARSGWDGLGLPEQVIGVELDALPKDVDLMIALGGDGTLLRASRWVADLGVPVLGVNLGDLGFLSAYSREQLLDALRDAIEGRLYWEPRLRMAVEVRRQGQLFATETAVNDVYIKHGQIPRLLRLDTRAGDQPLALYKADGLIVSTPLGSTAYNLAAGGPIVAPGTWVFTITPICPHSLTLRPVVVSARDGVTVIFAGPSGETDAYLSADGQWQIGLELGDEIRMSAAETPLRLVPAHASVFQVLTAKLGWSGPGNGG
ncbi:MAG TPA: NAD(+)/NADH kinase [Enhygromyxa sp.]|nr:NAD(+)/NADH kinase [Enhygromyxa sp.]